LNLIMWHTRVPLLRMTRNMDRDEWWCRRLGAVSDVDVGC